MEVKKVVLLQSEPRKGVWGLGTLHFKKANQRIRVFPEMEFTRVYVNNLVKEEKEWGRRVIKENFCMCVRKSLITTQILSELY